MSKELLIIRAKEVKNATQIGENTANRVGGLIEDVVKEIPDVDFEATERSTHAVKSGGVYSDFEAMGEDIYLLNSVDAGNPVASDNPVAPRDYAAGDVFCAYQGDTPLNHSRFVNARLYYVALQDGNEGDDMSGNLFMRTLSALEAIQKSSLVKLEADAVSVNVEQTFAPTQVQLAQRNIGLEKGVANGVASLDTHGIIPQEQVNSISLAPQTLDETQKVQAQNNMMAKSYVPAQFSGLGKKILAKNIQDVGGVDKNVMTQAFFQDEHGNALTNTVFVIQYDYTLGEDITVPENCVLEFDGGSISGDGTGKDTILATYVLLNDWKFNNIKFSDSTSFDFVRPINVPVNGAKEFCETILSYKNYDSLTPTIFLFSSNLPYDWDDVLNINKKCVTLTGGGVIRGHIQIGVDVDTYKIRDKEGWDGNRMCVTVTNLTFNKIGKIGRVTDGGSKDTVITNSNVGDFIKYATINDAYDDNYASITLFNANYVKITDCFFHNVPFPVAYKANRAVPGEALPDPNDNNYKIQQVMRRINISNCDFERCYIAVYAPSNCSNMLEYGDLEINFCNIFPHLHGLMVKHIDGFKCFNNVFNTGYDQKNWESVNILAEACFTHIANNGFYGELNVASLVMLYPQNVQIVGNGFHAQHNSPGMPYKYPGLINIINDANHYVGYCSGCVISDNLFNTVKALPIYINERVRGCAIKGNVFTGTHNEMYKRTLYYIGSGVNIDELQPITKHQNIDNKLMMDARLDAIVQYKKERETYKSVLWGDKDFTTSITNDNNIYHVRRITKVKPIVAITDITKNLSQCEFMFDGVYFTINQDYSTQEEALVALKTKVDELFSTKFNTQIIAGVLWIVGKETNTEVYTPFTDLNNIVKANYQNLGYRVELWDKDNKNHYNNENAFAAFDLDSNNKSVIIDNLSLTQVCTKTTDKYMILNCSNAPSGYSDIYILDDTFFAKNDNSVSTADALSAIVALCYSDRYSVSGTTLTCLEANKEWTRLSRSYGWWCSANPHVVDVKYLSSEGREYNTSTHKFKNVTDGNLAGFDTDGKIVDSGKKPSDFAPATGTPV